MIGSDDRRPAGAKSEAVPKINITVMESKDRTDSYHRCNTG